MEQEYNQFIKYVKGTWGQLLETDWKNEPEIKKVIINKRANTFTVLVYLNQNVYYEYDFEKRELLEVEYDGSKPIKTSYSLNDDLILHMLVKSNIIEDLGLTDDVEIVLFDFIDGIKYDEDLTKNLHEIEGDYAYTLYCIEHDL